MFRKKVMVVARMSKQQIQNAATDNAIYAYGSRWTMILECSQWPAPCELIFGDAATWKEKRAHRRPGGKYARIPRRNDTLGSGGRGKSQTQLNKKRFATVR